MYKNNIKPIIDKVLAIIIFIGFFPIFIFICCILMIEQKKSPFFVQERHGFKKKPFKMIKFRTLKEDHKVFRQTTSTSDDVTYIGRFLRATHLDEIPQLLNIILGHMSFIGPRPHFPEHDRDIVKRVPNFLERYNVKPGFTGLAQVSNNRGAIKNHEHAIERLKYDTQYIKDCSLSLDIVIFFKSLNILLKSFFTN